MQASAALPPLLREQISRFVAPEEANAPRRMMPRPVGMPVAASARQRVRVGAGQCFCPHDRRVPGGPSERCQNRIDHPRGRHLRLLMYRMCLATGRCRWQSKAIHSSEVVAVLRHHSIRHGGTSAHDRAARRCAGPGRTPAAVLPRSGARRFAERDLSTDGGRHSAFCMRTPTWCARVALAARCAIPCKASVTFAPVPSDAVADCVVREAARAPFAQASSRVVARTASVAATHGNTEGFRAYFGRSPASLTQHCQHVSSEPGADHQRTITPGAIAT